VKQFVWFMCMVVAAAAAGEAAVAQDEATQPGVPFVSNASFDPPMPETGAKLKLHLKLESAARAEVRWSINGEEVETLDYDGLAGLVSLSKPIRAEDRIGVTVIPFDASGTPGTELKKTVVCGNAPPMLRVANQNLSGDTYTAKIEAKDPENDAVTLSLEGPPGMRIDQKGNVAWKIGPGTSGSFTVVVTGKDDKGGQGVLTYSIGIRR
jgi:hypothetical protein